MLAKLIDWLDERAAIKHLWHEAANEEIPGGAKARYVFGSVLMYLFIQQVVLGILHAWRKLGVLAPDVELEPATHAPLVAHDGNVHYLNAEVSGMFVPSTAHWMRVERGSLLGRIVSPLRGEVLEDVVSPVDGVVFTLREYPLVYEGSLLARIMENGS